MTGTLVARWLALLLLGFAAAAGVNAQPALRDSAVKAAFLFKFPNFVDWPAGTFNTPADPLVIAVYGDDQVATELEQLAAARQPEGRPVVVRRVREGEVPSNVQVLYAAGPREVRARELLSNVAGPVLTVGEMPASGPAPVLAFVIADGRVRFNASIPASAARNLRLSARLLAVANQVEGRP